MHFTSFVSTWNTTKIVRVSCMHSTQLSILTFFARHRFSFLGRARAHVPTYASKAN